MPHQRHDVLIGRSADINDVVAAFKPFISCRMPEQALGAFDDGDDLLARRRSVTADDMIDLRFANELVACGMIGGDDPAGIAQMGRENEIERHRSWLISSTAINALLRISPAIMA